MTTKPCECCKGTGRRTVAPWESFLDELHDAGVLVRLTGYFNESRPEESDAAVEMHHRCGATVSLIFGDILDDGVAQIERIERFRAELDKLGGLDALVRG